MVDNQALANAIFDLTSVMPTRSNPRLIQKKMSIRKHVMFYGDWTNSSVTSAGKLLLQQVPFCSMQWIY